ncbi:SDR family NAD(P)-dependent oxidoreductase, partial [Anaerostipes sp.]|uniref:SDR family NAD(P)-dependent oxidoreductase n=1 Tax=Anaerostipes sp. TaxID=1872530 RepID=UPI0025C319CE
MNESWLGLNGRTVIVTGGASGIGKAVAQEFLNVGCNVVVSDMAPEVPEFDTANGKFHYVKTDVTSAKDVDAMVKETVDTFGTVDVL